MVHAVARVLAGPYVTEMGSGTEYVHVILLISAVCTHSKKGSSLKILLLVVVLWANWEILAPYVSKDLPNPFTPLLFISHYIPSSSPDDPRYQKGYLDLVFVAYHIVLWSFVRQSITIYICRPIARYFGIKKAAKLDRFGEQAYAVIYFAVMGAWGVVRLGSARSRSSLLWYAAHHVQTTNMVV